jgi:hypothetical protein
VTVGGWKGLLRALATEACERYAVPNRRLEKEVRLALDAAFPGKVFRSFLLFPLLFFWGGGGIPQKRTSR